MASVGSSLSTGPARCTPSTSPASTRLLGPLNPTDGAFGLGLGGSYTTDSGVKIGGGVEYRWLGDSDIQGRFASAKFRDNYGLGMGLTLSVPF